MQSTNIDLSKKRGCNTGHIFLPVLIICLMILPGSLFAQDEGDVDITGAYLGLFNILDQENSEDYSPSRNQFDLAANINFNWQIRENILGVFQLQGSPGEGSFGFPGSEVEITDLNVEFSFDDYDSKLTVGSFDTPFGMQTASLSNNGNSFGNPLLLNSLFYCAFAGAPMGTLNTVGAMGNYNHEYFDATLAFSNGTNESADNSDGGFEISGTAVGKIPVSEGELDFAFSYINSDDRSESGSNGTESDFSGFLAEGMFAPIEGAHVKGYYGMISYDDNDSDTDDDVNIWMAEGRYGREGWHLGVRISGWMPENDDGNGIGISEAIPNPGLAVQINGAIPYTDQKITRIQAGGGYMIVEDLIIKAELFLDNYDQSTLGDATDVQGVILGLNGRF
ncbi:MAG: hypothetical protein GF310_06885 [candidate division Zixibacteria bacterium]|nr:hypothetical protein [candidate division Zixibacteria bacterium]